MFWEVFFNLVLSSFFFVVCELEFMFIFFYYRNKRVLVVVSG